jgi:hypothetical protein
VATVRKTYSVDIVVSADDIDRGKIMKIGEVPRFGDSLRGRGVELLEGDQEDLRKGHQCETQGLGVGAFSYYRRVVENTKDRVFEDVIKVAEALRAPDELLWTFEQRRRSSSS